MIKTNNMLTRSTFYNKKIQLTLFLNIHISKRSIHLASWNSLCHHQGTHITLPQRLTIIKRFMFKNTVNKGKECVGNHCKEALKGMTTVNPNQTATPPVDNAASNLQKNPDSQNTPLPLTEITQPMTPPTTSQDTPQPPSKFTKPPLDPAIEYGLPVSTQDKIAKVTSSTQEQLSTPLLDDLQNQKSNTEDSKPTSTDNVKAYVVKQTATKKSSIVSDTTDNKTPSSSPASIPNPPPLPVSKPSADPHSIVQPITNEVLEANCKLPAGIDLSTNATDQTSLPEQEQTSTSTYSRGYGSSSQNNSGPLGTQSPNHRTTLTTENTQAVPNTHVRGYVTPPPGEGYTVYNVEKTKKPDPKKPGKDIDIPNVVDSHGQEIPHHEANHMILRDNETGMDVGVFTSNKNAHFVASTNVENKLDKNGKPKEQHLRIYGEPRDSRTASEVKEYKKGTAFAKQHNDQIDKHVVDSGITDKTPTKRINRDSPELFHENGYSIYDVNGKEIEYDFNPNVPSPVKTNNDASQPSNVDNEEKND